MQNSRIAEAEIDFARGAVASPVEVGAAYALPPGQMPTVVSPLSVAYRSQRQGAPPKKRLIFNGMYVNMYIEKRRFVYESISMVSDL